MRVKLYLGFVFFLFFTKPLFSQVQSVPSEWWKETTIYQIYPRSWFDTNGDGIGDLQGIIEKLDYIKELGYESIWISPYLLSPQRDFGYDVSDYQSIAPEYGTMELFEKLVQEIHQRKMKLIFDLVMNHTSDQHAWFKESASSRNNPKADWYIWKEGKGKQGLKRPNNWRAMTGKKAWIYSPERKQFYYAAFLPFQPDLNYNNPQVKQAMFDIVRFWLNKGVDGFRLDIISAIYEDSTLKNNPISMKIMPSDKSLSIYFQHLQNNFLQENSFKFATELRNVIDEFPQPERFLLGESHGDEYVIRNFCDYKNKKGLKAVFLFKAISMPFKAKAYRKMLQRFNDAFPAPLIPTFVFGNHDRTRLMTRLGGRVEKAKLLAFFQFTARGIPFTYFGEEIGIPNVKIPLKEGKDAIAIQNKNLPQDLVNLSIETMNRDECRTPMLWTGKSHGGFCAESVKPWLPVAANYKDICVEKQLEDPNSQLNFFKKIIHLRNTIPALQKGSLEIAEDLCTPKILAYYRILDDKKYLILLNISQHKLKSPLTNAEMILSTHLPTDKTILQPYEGRVFLMNQ